jgi:DUF971 family protein
VVKPRAVELGEQGIAIRWSDGHESVYSNKSLRDACPCAACQGESNPIGGSGRLPMAQDAPSDVRALRFRMVGLYAVAFEWSDGHSTGIYPYDYLIALCECGSWSSKRG